MEELNAIGIDLAKHVFHIVGVTERGRVIYRKRVGRRQLIGELAKLARCCLYMEACGGAHYWGRKLKGMGFEVKLIAPQFVKPFVKSNKNDWLDAEAIAEAGQRASMRFVGVKSIGQQELQLLHRVRERLVKQSTAMTNELRGILQEFGIVISKGKKPLSNIPELLEMYPDEMTEMGRQTVLSILQEWRKLDEQISEYDKKLLQISRQHPVCKRLMTIPGVGPIVSSAIVAAVSNPADFKNGRQFGAWLGLVPKQESTGGKPRLLGISKRGDVYIRKQLVHGARSLLYVAHKKKDRMSVWATSLKHRKGWNKAAVAVANKNARIIWALLYYEKDYEAPPQTLAA